MKMEKLLAYKWEFGDGTVSNEQNPTHVYKRRNIYGKINSNR